MGRPSEAKESRRRILRLVATVVGIVIQVPLTFMILMGGLNWTGWRYTVAVAQGLVGLVIIAVFARRFPVVALVVPVVSYLLWTSLWTAGMSEGHNPRACTASEEAMLRELTPPEATLGEVRGDNDRCFAIITTPRSGDELRAQYDLEFVEHGWEKVSVDYPYGTAAVRDGLRVYVEALPEKGETFMIDLTTG